MTEGDGHVQVCVQFVKLSDDKKDIFWENFPVSIITVDGSAVGKYLMHIRWNRSCLRVVSGAHKEKDRPTTRTSLL